MSEHGRVEGKAALVTGASSGLGRATAIALAGADVALAAGSKDELQGAKGEISELGRRALTLPLDLASETDTAEAVGRTFEAFERIDISINAAGTDAPGTVEELSVEGWDRTLDVNLRAPFLLSKAAFPHMREAGSGTIVNISSVAGKKGWVSADRGGVTIARIPRLPGTPYIRTSMRRHCLSSRRLFRSLGEGDGSFIKSLQALCGGNSCPTRIRTAAASPSPNNCTSMNSLSPQTC